MTYTDGISDPQTDEEYSELFTNLQWIKNCEDRSEQDIKTTKEAIKIIEEQNE
jgi:hypothetical protein